VQFGAFLHHINKGICMKPMIYFTMITSFMAILSCKTKAVIQNENIDNNQNVELVLQLKKTPCYGECPAYVFRIYDDGSAIYRGVRFVSRIGDYRGQVDSTKLVDIMDRFESIQFTTLDAKYVKEHIMDLPSTIIKYDAHTVEYQFNRAPKELKDLSTYLEQIIEAISWTQVPAISDL
jgi:hypothetical protein